MSGERGSYGRAGILLYDDAFCVEGGDTEVLTLNAVDTRTQRTGQALATETFVFGGTFLNVMTLKHDAPEILGLVLDSVMSTHSYGARSRHYGRMQNTIIGVVMTERPIFTAYGLVGRAEKSDDAYLQRLVKETSKAAGGRTIDIPMLDSRADVMRRAHKHPSVQAWIKEVEGYLAVSNGKPGKQHGRR